MLESSYSNLVKIFSFLSQVRLVTTIRSELGVNGDVRLVIKTEFLCSP